MFNVIINQNNSPTSPTIPASPLCAGHLGSHFILTSTAAALHATLYYIALIVHGQFTLHSGAFDDGLASC